MSKPKNRFDKYMNIFGENDDLRIRLFISELEQLAIDLAKKNSQIKFNTDLFPENWIFNPNVYTKGMMSRNYKHKPKCDNRLGNLFAINDRELIPPIDDNSIHPEFLSYIIIVCFNLNNTEGPIELDSTHDNDKFTKMKKEFENLVNMSGSGLDTCIFIKMLLDKLKITYERNNQPIDKHFDIACDNAIHDITKIKIPSFIDLLYDISHIVTDAAIPYPNNNTSVTNIKSLLGTRGAYGAPATTPPLVGGVIWNESYIFSHPPVAGAGQTTINIPTDANIKDYYSIIFPTRPLVRNPVAGAGPLVGPLYDTPLYNPPPNTDVKSGALNNFDINALNTLAGGTAILPVVIIAPPAPALPAPRDLGVLTKFDINLYNIDTKMILLINILRYIFNIPGEVMSKLITNSSTHTLYKYPLAALDNAIKTQLFTHAHADITSFYKCNKVIDILKGKINSTNLPPELLTHLRTLPANELAMSFSFNNLVLNYKKQVTDVVYRANIVASFPQVRTSWNTGGGNWVPNVATSVVPANDIYINMWTLIIENLNEIIFDDRRFFNWRIEALVDSTTKENIGKIPINISPTDSWFEDNIINDYIRNNAGVLCKLNQDGSCDEINNGSKLFEEIISKQTSAEQYGLDELNNKDLIDQFLIECLVIPKNSKSSALDNKKCTTIFNDPHFFTVAKDQIKDMLPQRALRVLELLEVPTYTKTETFNNKTYKLLKYRDYNHWLEKVVNPKVDGPSFISIKNNIKLAAYINFLIKKINTNPAILNKTSYPSLEVYNHKSTQKKHLSTLSQLTNYLKIDRTNLLDLIKNVRLRAFKSRLVVLDPMEQHGGLLNFNLNNMKNPYLINKANEISFSKKNFRHSYIEFDNLFNTYERQLKTYNKTIASQTKQKINELLFSLKRNEEKLFDALTLYDNYYRILKTFDNNDTKKYSEEEVTLHKLQNFLDKNINKNMVKVSDISSIFKSLIENSTPDEDPSEDNFEPIDPDDI